MDKQILIKRSSVEDATPLVSDLADGELALNTHDGNLYTKYVDEDDVVQVGSFVTQRDLDEQAAALGLAIWQNAEQINSLYILANSNQNII